MTHPAMQPSPSQPIPQTATCVRVASDFGIDNLVFDSVPVAQPAHGQVLVQMKAASLNYRDLLVAIGKYNPKLHRPMTLCSDGSGQVIAVGEGVTLFKPGDRVMSSFFQNWISGPYTRAVGKSALGGGIDGVLTTACLLNEQGLLAIPDHLSYEEAATLPCAALTAWHALVPSANLRSGQTVLILGTGGVSIFGLQFAKMHGARAIVTSSSDEKLARAKSLGADEVINYKRTPDWDKEVLRLTDGEGADVVLEVGGIGTMPYSLRSAKFGGQVALIGVLSGISDALNIGPILHGTLRVQGIYVGSVEMFQAMNRAISHNKLKPVVDRVFPFAQTREALRHMESAQHFGKIVISIEK
jgi:NADPH:quinone reductase-like Zn-dependent oxidoreductase